MKTEETRQLVQHWLSLAGSGNVEGAMALFAEDAVWTNIGSTKFSGDFVGLKAITEDLLAPLFGALEDGIHSEVESVIADGEQAVVLSRGAARTRSGVEYNNSYAQVFTVRGGKIVSVREYMDTALIDRVFA
ncbi:nuclear transport factor 2 family protein [Congregibacter litoralis]|nr:nuclear transport factor 2 family protein [Congregibacter litoralis]